MGYSFDMVIIWLQPPRTHVIRTCFILDPGVRRNEKKARHELAHLTTP